MGLVVKTFRSFALSLVKTTNYFWLLLCIVTFPLVDRNDEG
jgi:hypothetical protein